MRRLTPEMLNWWERHIAHSKPALSDEARAEYQRILESLAQQLGYVRSECASR